MKNYLIHAISLILVLMLTGCGGGEDGAAAEALGGVSLSARATSSTTIELTWSKPGGGFSTSSYSVASDDNGSSRVIGSTSERRYTVAGLSPGTRYCFVIKVPLLGTRLSNTACATTPGDSTPPSTPTGLAVRAVSTTQVELDWNNASDNAGSVSYRIYRDDEFLFTSAGSSAVDAHARPEATHCYQVSATDSAGNVSAKSAQACVTMAADTENPTAPTNLTAEFQADTEPSQIALNWSAATDDGAIADYEIYRNDSFLNRVDDVYYADTDLIPETTYCYTVVAVDAVGKKSEPSNEVCVGEGFTVRGLGAESTLIAQLAIDRSDNPVISYKQRVFDTYASVMTIPLSLVRLENTQPTETIELASGIETFSLNDGYEIGMAIDDNDTLHLLHKINHPTAPESIDYLQLDGDSIMTETFQQTTELLGTVALALDATGSAHACYDLGSRLYYATNLGGSWVATDLSTQVAITSGNYCDITIDINGFVHISFLEQKDLKYITNRDMTWQLEVVDLHSGSPVEIYAKTSIVTDASGNAHIAFYHDYEQLDLEYATNASGSWLAGTIDSGVVEGTVDAGGDAGHGCDIAIDSMGYIHISYLGGESLKYATNVSGDWQESIITDAGTGDTSIAIDSNDNIHISFLRDFELMYTTNRR